jgi:hypothetical protein
MLTIQFIPYNQIAYLDSGEKIRKLLKEVKLNKIVLMQGRLNPSEETNLIQQTMEVIDEDFKGVEICTVYPAAKDTLGKVRSFLLGSRDGVTVIGPASIVKEIRRNPNKIELFTIEKSSKKSKSRRKR